VKRRLGIDYDALSKINPRLIYASISGFGQSGPYRDRPGYDQIAQGMGALMSITGLPGQGPVRVGIPIADLTAGMFLAHGIMVALYEREKSGKGQWVHTSLLEAMVRMLDFQFARWTVGGEIPPQAGNDHPTGIPTGVFRTSDGHINIAASGQHMFKRLCEAVGRPELVNDPRFVNAKDRSKNRKECNAELDAALMKRSSAEWVATLNEAGVPCGPIYDVKEMVEDPQVQHLGLATEVKHPMLGTLRVQNLPVTLSRTPGAVRTAAPEAGEHSDEILGEIGYTAARPSARNARARRGRAGRPRAGPECRSSPPTSGRAERRRDPVATRTPRCRAPHRLRPPGRSGVRASDRCRRGAGRPAR
jgi:formyl-CoA transferase